MRILIVEDDLDMIDLYKEILKKYGYSVEYVVDGEKAIELYKEAYSKGEKFDCIIMDYRVPVKNGLIVAKEILKIDRKAKIIFATVEGSVEREALRIGAKRFLKKPFDIDSLIHAVRT
ncbi:MAG: response regulator [Methanomicrobia archaeon]|nr:response regulator [Methanomicrobia archaeon]